MAFEGLRVWAVPNNTRADVTCLLAVSTLKGTLALLRYGHGFDRWANKNSLWGGEGEMFKDVVIDMFDALTWNNLRLPTVVKDATPRFITYSPHVGAFHFCIQFESDYLGNRDVFLRELFGALLLQIRNGYSKTSAYRDRMSSSRWMRSADAKVVTIMRPEEGNHALNFKKMVRLQLRKRSIFVSCGLHERHYEEESRLFGYFFNVTGNIMCWHCGNPIFSLWDARRRHGSCCKGLCGEGKQEGPSIFRMHLLPLLSL
jgi:hypothetical protein